MPQSPGQKLYEAIVNALTNEGVSPLDLMGIMDGSAWSQLDSTARNLLEKVAKDAGVR